MKTTAMRKYKVFLEDRDFCYKCFIPAKNEKEAREYVQGNGEVIAVKDVTEDYPISVEKVAQALANANFGKAEIDLITRALQETNIAD